MTPVRVRRHTRRRVQPQVRKFHEPVVPAFHVVTGEEPLGTLLAGRERERLCTTETKLFGIDRLLGDDEFVFLSVGKPFELGERGATCFLFDAEELVREGALVRTKDILRTPQGEKFLVALDDAHSSRLNDFAELMEDPALNKAEEEYLEELREVLGTEFEVEKIGPLEMTEVQIRWFIKNEPKIKAAWNDFVAARKEITLSGNKALTALRDCDECEILVPRRLAIAKALRISALRRRPVRVRGYQRRR